MRSLLFVPGDSPRKMEKALTSGADVLILDLEDSVGLDDKAAARETTAEFLKARTGDGPRMFVRVNPFNSGLTRDDLAAVLPGCPDGLVQPKTRSGDDVGALEKMAAELIGEASLEGPTPEICVIATETAASVFTMGSYSGCSARLTALSWGAEDLSADIGASTNRLESGTYSDPFRLARSLALFAAHAAEVDAIDTVYTNFRNTDGLRDECIAAVRDGFTGKLAIHPAQVPVINEVFSPSPEDVGRAKRVFEAFEAAGNPGVVGLDGEMLDRPHLLRARKLLDRAEQYGLAT